MLRNCEVEGLTREYFLKESWDKIGCWVEMERTKMTKIGTSESGVILAIRSFILSFGSTYSKLHSTLGFAKVNRAIIVIPYARLE